MNDRPRHWRLLLAAAIIVWLALVVRLMVADVWDETNGMLFFSSPAMGIGAKLEFVATQSLGFWRPIPTSGVALVLHYLPRFDTSWRLLRLLNAALLLGAAGFFIDAMRHWRQPAPATELAFVLGMLFSGSAFITAGWYANVFDASALLTIAAGTALLSRRQTLYAGLLFGLAFFCKETAALVLPFLMILFAGRYIDFRGLVRAGTPAVFLGMVYFILRSRVVAFGSAGDIHQFQPELFGPSTLHLAQTFWLQNLKSEPLAWAGLAAFAASIAALRRPRLIGAALVFVAATAVVYWGMFWEFQNGVLLHHLNFAGRLYLIPAALLLMMLALERRTAVVAGLLIPIVIGGVMTWRDHLRFQETYREIYAVADHGDAVTVHFPPKPLDDGIRGVRIGDFPGAPLAIDPRTGALSRLQIPSR